MQVKDIMTPNATTIQTGASLTRAAYLMRDANIGFIPVVDGKRLVGIITDRDIVIRAVADNRPATEKTVGDFMSDRPVCCQEDDDVNDVVRKMEKYRVRRLPVIDDNHTIVGVVALGDIAQRMSHAVSGELLSTVSRHGDLVA
ncbi:CBS domain-containing protein [Maricaulis virginensis]|uniref:CBS domain-containing protein n=1 Tax=Maricaulis virginensis TaxID=144022 RepID=A0A9W6IL28_9PROT|nr:CBS domain-containing protein [Maricaulis virginensis]GLK52262.1 CBS domain-containing protein [Maricaulis virginensis]